MNRTEILGRSAPLLGALALLVSAGTSSAAITGHRWEVVDNSTYTLGSNNGNPSGLASNIYTFDLYLQDNGVDPLTALDSNDSGINPNDGLAITGGTFHQVQLFGSDNDLPPSLAEAEFLPALEFDTYVALGPLTDAQILVASDIDFGVAGGTRLRGVWSPNPGSGVGSTVPTDENGEIFVGRFSIVLGPGFDPNTAFFGGEILAALASGTPQIVTIGNAFDAIPSPGGAALFGLAGLTAMRRRR